MEIKAFAAASSDLQTGINLIEASAGTGKTYAIAMLALRFIVEQDLHIEQLLIVTFTNAASDELKDRIRIRLNDARRALQGNHTGLDETLIEWAVNLKVDHQLAKKRLQLALLNIDQSGIFTIHGFCQRILNEHALESGQLFDSELSGDISAIRQQIADDFWREQVYPLYARHAAILTAQYPTPDALLSSVGNTNPDDIIYPALEDLNALLAKMEEVINKAILHLNSNAESLKQAITDDRFKPVFVRDFEQHRLCLEQWLQGQTLVMPGTESFNIYTYNGLLEALNGSKFRSNKQQSGIERKTEYIQSLNIDFEPFNQLSEMINAVTLTFRRTLVDRLHTELSKRLQQLNLLSFDDLITRLSEVLKGSKSALLKNELQNRFKVALIDEFQDTDNKQWLIFSQLFDSDEHSLFLIGDPKQAIYKFRGADIFSYFTALEQAQHCYTLDKNWRSHPLLVKATNNLFEQCPKPHPFVYQQLPFNPVQPGLTAEQGVLMINDQSVAPMVLMQFSENDSKNGYWSIKNAGKEIMITVINEITLLLDPVQKAAIHKDKQTDDTKLQAKDIAILVRSNNQALAYQNALREVNVPSVLNSNESVFLSQEATDLFILLQSIAHPGDIKLLKQALTLSWFNLDGQRLIKTINDELILDDWLTRFQNYFQYWQSKGFMAMMLHLMEMENIQLNLTHSANPERQLTNLHQLIELLQQAVVDEHLGIHKTLGWLQSALTSPAFAEQSQLRLESDAEAVRIITMHRAKGLEFPVVFCPYLWHWSSRLQKEQELIKCHDNVRHKMLADLGSRQFEQHREQALYEQLAEDMRILYVAITRAKYRCYIAWANVRSEKIPNHSALNYLLFGHQDMDFAAQQEHMTKLCQQAPESFVYRLLPFSAEISGYHKNSTQRQKLSAHQWQGRLTSHWQMSSYTALSALSLHDSPELPSDKAQEQSLSELDQQHNDPIPRGAHTGNVLHELLEKISFQTLATDGDIALPRNQACQRFGLHLEQPGLLDNLLKNVVLTPLSDEDDGFILAGLEQQHCLKEMPFYLSMDEINTHQINAILAQSPTFQPLTEKQMRGYLTGFIDLICLYQGRYYLMDYKSNGLPDYQTATLTHAMREHNYGLQYWIYTLVLHRYLQNRLRDYSYYDHFGGVRYLFIRGMQPDMPMSGIFQDIPDFERVNQLDVLFEDRS